MSAVILQGWISVMQVTAPATVPAQVSGGRIGRKKTEFHRIFPLLLKLSLGSLVMSAGRPQWGGDGHHLPLAVGFLGELPALLPHSTFLKCYEQGRKCLKGCRKAEGKAEVSGSWCLAPGVWLQAELQV